jgi:transposase-like protein
METTTPHPDDDRPAVRNIDPDTSHDAFDALTRKSVLQGQVVALLVERGGMTVSELAYHIGVPRDTISPRMTELEEQGRVLRSMLRRLPLVPDNHRLRSQIMWFASETELHRRKTAAKRGDAR